MAEPKLTSAQQAVVDDRGGPLLVSAAAGSGKTKVLIDRLMSRICDPDDPCNIDDFLVITYTKAAAAELRLKITRALSARMANEPGNRHLQQQMRRIYLAEISTVHAFCAEILRSYAHLLDIPGDFHMIEETEAQVLQKRVLDLLLEEGYAQLSDDFSLMVETFGYGRDDRRLAEAVLMADRAMRCRADMKKWLDDTLEALDISNYQDVTQTPWGAYVVREFRAFLSRQIERLNAALAEMKHYPKIEKAYAATFSENVAMMQQLLLEDSWDGLFSKQIDSFGKLKAVRDPEDLAVKERIAKLRKKCWADLQKWQQFFYAPSNELLDDLAQVMPGAQALIRFSEKFDRAYAKEKRDRKLLDFSDLEHLAIRLLTDRYTGKPTAVAREIAGRYVEIMVDEYQDSNQVQEVIFEAVSQNGKNRFMVGDVKQSIYRFRLADPTLFLNKYEAYPHQKEAVDGEPRKILLSENFRSRPEILQACNDVFRLIMRKQVGDLDYGPDEELRPGRTFEKLPQPLVELHCLTASEQEIGVDKRDLEAEFIAGRIQKMLDDKIPITDGDGTRPVRPGDIVILMRSVSNNAQTYLRALEQKGIPAVYDQGGNLLDTTEVQLLISMLQIIDNPHQDVPLLTVLASPLFGYSPDQLAQARIKSRKEDMFEAISSDPSFEDFIILLHSLREESIWLPVHDLVDRILHITNLLYVFSSMQDGLQREKNLMAFSSFVVNFEANGSRSLQQLLQYLSNLQTNGGQLPVPQNTAENAVTIMSIHKSKGLEFPVVCLCDLSRQFNMQDMRESILVDDVMAVGCNRVDTARFVRYPTLAKKSIEHKKQKESISEELRVLYVAMTRPKDMLVMTYYSKFLIKELEALNSQITMPLSDDLCASVNNPGKWVLLAALCRTEAGELLNLVGGNDAASVSQMPWKIKFHDLSVESEEAKVRALPTQERENLDPAAISLLNNAYNYRDICDVPAKLTATQLKGRVQDQEAAEGATELESRRSYRFRKAEFLPKELTAAEKGTANHLFLQFASYEACTSGDAIKRELERLIQDRFLSPAQAAAVQTEKIVRFFETDLGQWLLSQPAVRREFKFSLLVDAGEYLPGISGEQMLLQGVVDCFVVEEDGITILDFKTDAVGKNAAERAAYYRPQLETYARALSKIYAMPVKRRILYFLQTNTAVDV